MIKKVRFSAPFFMLDVIVIKYHGVPAGLSGNAENEKY